MWSELLQKIKAVLSGRSSEHEIALGFTVGAAISVLPTPGFNLLLGAFFVAVYPHANKLAVFAAMAFYNPIVMIPFYWASYQLGALIFAQAPVVDYDVVVLDQAYDFTRRYLVGNVIVAAATSAVTYPLVRKLVRWKRSRAEARSGQQDFGVDSPKS